MPEGHTVHRLARVFGELFSGQQVAVSSPQGRFAAGAALLDGSVVRVSEAVGKQMFLGLGPAGDDVDEAGLRWLRVHLGLYGAWTFAGDPSTAVVHAIGAPRTRVGERETTLAGATTQVAGPTSAGGGPGAEREDGPDAEREDGSGWEPPAPRGAVRVRLVSAHASADLTGPTACEVLTLEQVRAVQSRLGPDPLRSDGAPERFVAAVARSRSPVGVLLMNQAVVAGVGNIYRAEVLFRAGLAPLAPGSSLPRETLRQVWDDLVVLTADGARTGAIVTTRPADRGRTAAGLGSGGPDGGPGRHRTRQNTDGGSDVVPREDSFYVYQRAGLPCRVCATPVAMADLAGRNLFWCPTCQR